MSRLTNYLILESADSGRTKEISREEFIDLARKHCKVAVRNFLNGRCTINRGSNNKDPFILGDARKAHVPRKSKNTTNHYTLWIDNHPQWKMFPKRSLSFICSSGEYGSHFGRYNHVILPYDGVRIGVVKGEDMWDTGYLSESINSDLKDLLRVMFQVEEDADRRFHNSDKDWDTLMWCIKEFDKMKVDDDGVDIPVYDWIKKYAYNDVTYNIFVGQHWKGTLEDTLEDMWSPNTNEVWLGDTSDTINDNDECWMEGPVLMLINDNVTLDENLEDFLREI